MPRPILSGSIQRFDGHGFRQVLSVDTFSNHPVTIHLDAYKVSGILTNFHILHWYIAADLLNCTVSSQHISIGYWMGSYVRQTSTHLAITRFSHRPLKFFFLMPVQPPFGEYSTIFPKTTLQNITMFRGKAVERVYIYTHRKSLFSKQHK